MAIHTAEANNVNKLGTYAFAYGLVIVSVFAGLLAMSVILGAPLQGAFGCVALFRLLFRILAVAIVGLGVYAFYCYWYSDGITRLRCSIQIGAVAMVFAALGMECSEPSTLILQMLGALGTEYHGLCLPIPLL